MYSPKQYSMGFQIFFQFFQSSSSFTVSFQTELKLKSDVVFVVLPTTLLLLHSAQLSRKAAMDRQRERMWRNDMNKCSGSQNRYTLFTKGIKKVVHTRSEQVKHIFLFSFWNVVWN